LAISGLKFSPNGSAIQLKRQRHSVRSAAPFGQNHNTNINIYAARNGRHGGKTEEQWRRQTRHSMAKTAQNDYFAQKKLKHRFFHIISLTLHYGIGVA